MDNATNLGSTGSVNQSVPPNLQNFSPPVLTPQQGNLQPAGNSAGSSNLNVSTTSRGIPLDSVSVGKVQAAYVTKAKPSHSPYLIGIGAFTIVAAVVGLVVSNYISGRNFSID